MTTVVDPRLGNSALVKQCKSCHAPVYWSFTIKGKRCPFDVVDGVATETSHFATCPQAKRWTVKA